MNNAYLGEGLPGMALTGGVLDLAELAGSQQLRTPSWPVMDRQE
jgi:hypothetical protein